MGPSPLASPGPPPSLSPSTGLLFENDGGGQIAYRSRRGARLPAGTVYGPALARLRDGEVLRAPGRRTRGRRVRTVSLAQGRCSAGCGRGPCCARRARVRARSGRLDCADRWCGVVRNDVRAVHAACRPIAYNRDCSTEAPRARAAVPASAGRSGSAYEGHATGTRRSGDRRRAGAAARATRMADRSCRRAARRSGRDRSGKGRGQGLTLRLHPGTTLRPRTPVQAP
jgi:hypothetical protein